MSKYQATLTILQERCERNRNEAHSRLHRAKEALLTVVERSLLELHRTVETRSEQIMSELRTYLKRYMSDKSYTLEALQPPASGALFRVAVGDSVFVLVQTVLKNCILLPEEAGTE